MKRLIIDRLLELIMTKIALSALQKQMINYLIDDDISIEQHIVQQGNISNKIRLHIYKNAYQARDRKSVV